MVGIVMAAEGIARVQRTALCKVQMIPVDKLAQIGRADKVLLLAQCIVQIQHIQPQLVGHDDIHIIGHAAGHPVVAADRLKPPDLVRILKGNAVHLISAVLLQQAAEAVYTLTRGADVGQDQINDVLLADAALDERVGPQHARVGGDGLGGGHADIGSVHAAGSPQALALHSVRHSGHPQAACGQGDLNA